MSQISMLGTYIFIFHFAQIYCTCLKAPDHPKPIRI